MRAPITVRKVDKFGQNPRTLTAAIISDNPTFEMNTYWRMTFALPLGHIEATHVAKYDEVVVMLYGVVVWWGVVVSTEAVLAEGQPARVTYRCADLLWYFSKRHVGKARRPNYALDPNF